jgi:TrmH family RNA methyltransferase
VIRDIAGRNNHTVKLARKLQKKKHRRERGLLVGEGMDLLAAAVEAGAEIHHVLARRDLLDSLPASLRASAEGEKPGQGLGRESTDVGLCDQDTLDHASSLGGAADVVFICRQPSRGLAALPLGQRGVFYLEGVGDPGNVGTLCRSALAFGLAGLICSPGTADPYSPKALRAGMGAQFWLPVVTDVSPDDLRAHLAGVEGRGGGRPTLLVADPHRGEDARSLVTGARSGSAPIVILGDEREGPQDPWVGAGRVTIRQARFDSLNVAMAGTILAYEISRCSK